MQSEFDLTVSDWEARMFITLKTVEACADHGEYLGYHRKKDDDESVSGCPECASEKQREKDRAEQESDRVKRAADNLEKKIGRACIPKRFASRRFDDYRADTLAQKRALTVCQEYADNFEDNFEAGRCLLLMGKPGTGKTHLAAAIGNQIMRAGKWTSVYATVDAILKHIKASFGSDTDYNETEAFEAFTSPSLLIIDEVGATKATEFETSTLFSIINSRYEEQMPTVVISNLRPDDLPTVLGERSVDRLREGKGVAVVFDWESSRPSL